MNRYRTGRDEPFRPKGYVSCIKINGRPILPPIMTEEIRSEMARYRELAIKIENRRRQEKLQLRDPESVSESDKEEFQSANNDLDPPSTPITPINFVFEEAATNDPNKKLEESTTPSSETCSNDDVKSVIETPRPNVGFRKFFESPVKTFDAILNNKSVSLTEKSDTEKINFNLSESESDSDKENREQFHSFPSPNARAPNPHLILTPEMSLISQKKPDEFDGAKSSKSTSFSLMPPPPPVPPAPTTSSAPIQKPFEFSEPRKFTNDDFFTNRRINRKTRIFSPEPHEQESDDSTRETPSSPKKIFESTVQNSAIFPPKGETEHVNVQVKQYTSDRGEMPSNQLELNEDIEESIYFTPFQFTPHGTSPQSHSLQDDDVTINEEDETESDQEKTPVKKGKHVRRLSYTLISPSAALLAASALEIIPPAYQALSPVKKDEDLGQHEYPSDEDLFPDEEEDQEEDNGKEEEKTLAEKGIELEKDLDVRIELLNMQMIKLQAGMKRNSEGTGVNKTYDVEGQDESEKEGTPGWLNKMVQGVEAPKKSPLSREKLSQTPTSARSASASSLFQNRQIKKSVPLSPQVQGTKNEISPPLQSQNLNQQLDESKNNEKIAVLLAQQEKQLQELMDLQRQEQEKLLEDFKHQLLAIEMEKILIEENKENCDEKDVDYPDDFEEETESEKGETSSTSLVNSNSQHSSDSFKSTSDRFDKHASALRAVSSEAEIPCSTSTDNSTLQGSMSVLSTDRESISNCRLSELHGKMQKSQGNGIEFKLPSDAKSPLLKGLTLPSRLERPSKSLIRTFPIIDDRMHTKFCKISAAVKGYLVRRILSTEKLQMIIQTIKETVKLILQLCEDDQTGNSFSIKKQDVELRRRLEQQLRGTCNSFSDVFFKLTTQQRMAIIANDREKIYLRARNPSPVKKSFSSATMKSIERRSGVSPKRGNRKNILKGQARMSSSAKGERNPNVSAKRRRMSFFDHHRTSTAPPQVRKPLFRPSTSTTSDQNGNKWMVSELTKLSYRPSNSTEVGEFSSARSGNTSTSSSVPNSARIFNSEQTSNANVNLKRFSISKTRWK